jgi:hypothetical protein
MESVESCELFMAVAAAADATMEALDVSPLIEDVLGLMDDTSERELDVEPLDVTSEQSVLGGTSGERSVAVDSPSFSS